MSAFVTFIFVVLETVLQDPTPPVYIPPPEPAALSADTLDAVRDAVRTRVYDGAACTVAASDDTIGPYRAVGTYIVEQKPEIPFEKWSRRVYVGEDPQPASGLDLIVTGQPMTRRQLRAIIDDARFPAHRMAIARIIAATDGAALGLRDVFNGEQPGTATELLGIVEAPRLHGAPGGRVFVFDAISRGTIAGPVRVTVQVDGEGALGARVVALGPVLKPRLGVGPALGAQPSLVDAPQLTPDAPVNPSDGPIPRSDKRP